MHDVGEHMTKELKGLFSLKFKATSPTVQVSHYIRISSKLLIISCSQESYGFKTMGSLNRTQVLQNSDSLSPSSAFEPGITVDIEISNLVSKAEIDNEDNENGRLPDVVVEAKMLGEDEEEPPMQETYLSIAIQVFIPFLIAGLGMVFAGLVLDRIQVQSNYFNSLLSSQIMYSIALASF